MQNKKPEIKLKERFLISGKLHLNSPLIIGTGEKTDIDIIVVKDEDGKPYIPATSIAGALRYFFFENLQLDENDRAKAEDFWGISKGETDKQSVFSISDLKAINSPTVLMRDGINIATSTGIVKEGKKFDYEIVEAGAIFKFEAQITLYEHFCENTFEKIIATIINALEEEKIFLGAMTAKGFGRCKLQDYDIYKYNYSEKRDVIAWLRREKNAGQKISLDAYETFDEKNNYLKLEAIFKLKNSLIIKTYSGEPSDSDAVHIKSRGRNILPGTSIKGALRSRALRIINTLGGPSAQMVSEIFGTDPDDTEQPKTKSRIFIEETEIKNVIEETQYRTCIDRFTGGAKDNALFDTKALWADKDGSMVHIRLTLKDYEKGWEAGLILLLLKDIWNGDLAIGGDKSIGRGTLQGIQARLEIGDKELFEIETKSIDSEEELLNIRGKEEMEKLVQAFVEECENREGAYNAVKTNC